MLPHGETYQILLPQFFLTWKLSKYKRGRSFLEHGNGTSMLHPWNVCLEHLFREFMGAYYALMLQFPSAVAVLEWGNKFWVPKKPPSLTGFLEDWYGSPSFFGSSKTGVIILPTQIPQNLHTF